MSKSLRTRQLSRTKIDLFLECPRCFHAEVVLALPRIGPLPYTLNNAVDHLFKTEFDGYRASGMPHPLFATVALDAVPYQHAQFESWRSLAGGVRWTDPLTGWTLQGVIDDVWQNADGSLHVADYKATSKATAVTVASLHEAFRRQAEVYQFLLRRQDFIVSSTAWFVYANGIKAQDRFDDCLRFTTSLLPYEGDDSWVLEAFRAAVAVATSPISPPPAASCKWCQFVEKRRALEAETHSAAVVA
jgi:RecB family exonuclease